ncbi:hypothetical protein ACX8XN_17025 [Calditrichota bacterium GD2]
MTQNAKMKTIWFFVGLLMVLIGGIITLTGVYLYFNPQATHTALAETHPNLWWGGIMIIFGIIMLLIKDNGEET